MTILYMYGFDGVCSLMDFKQVDVHVQQQLTNKLLKYLSLKSQHTDRKQEHAS